MSVGASGVTTCAVVVVDDEPAFLEVARAIIGRYPGARVVGTATSGEQALEVVPRLRPDLVVLDVQMPGIGGFEAARRLTAALGSLRVVMVSAHEEPQYEAIALAAGAETFLSKKAFLLEGIGRVLG